MKEVFTKSFWEGVKKTFNEAREGAALGDNAVHSPDGEPSLTTESPAARSVDPASTKPTPEAFARG
jgi:hypothetical protein